MQLSKTVFRGVIVLSLAVVGAAAWWLTSPLPLRQASASLEIALGEPPRAIARAWVDAGVRTPALALYAWFRLSGQATKIRAGNYEIHAGVTPWSLLSMMVQGSQAYASVRLGEGWTLKQVRQELDQAPGLEHTIDGMSDALLIATAGADPSLADAAFFPDTYHYAKGSKDVEVLQRAGQLMARRLQAAWDSRDAGLPLDTPAQLLTLASMVEKETGRADDRGRVAAVFVNRLRLGMPLQSDPTVIYGMGNAFDGNLHHEDLLRDTAFNTYTRKGLPPTPIATVSLDSLRAAAHPAPTHDLYFVARGDGSSAFSTSLEAHNMAVNRYQKHRTP